MAMGYCRDDVGTILLFHRSWSMFLFNVAARIQQHALLFWGNQPVHSRWLVFVSRLQVGGGVCRTAGKVKVSTIAIVARRENISGYSSKEENTRVSSFEGPNPHVHPHEDSRHATEQSTVSSAQKHLLVNPAVDLLLCKVFSSYVGAHGRGKRCCDATLPLGGSLQNAASTCYLYTRDLWQFSLGVPVHARVE